MEEEVENARALFDDDFDDIEADDMNVEDTEADTLDDISETDTEDDAGIDMAEDFEDFDIEVIDDATDIDADK